MTFAAVLKASDFDDVLANTKLRYVLEIPGEVRQIKATSIMEAVGIIERRGLRGPGEQRTELLARLT